MIELLSSPEAWISLAVLTLMEVVLGIDNIVFITILCGRLPKAQQLLGRRLGLAGALVTRVLLLLTLNWLAHLEAVLFELWRPWSGRDLVLLGGACSCCGRPPGRSTRTSNTRRSTNTAPRPGRPWRRSSPR